MQKKHLSTALYASPKILHRFLFLVLLLISPLIASSLQGQTGQKKHLTEADYNLWKYSDMDKLSPDGLWASYITTSESGSDTLFVRNTLNAKTYFILSCQNSIFTQDDFFYCQSGNDLQYINLKN